MQNMGLIMQFFYDFQNTVMLCSLQILLQLEYVVISLGGDMTRK